MISFNPKLVKNSIALLLALLCFSLPCLRVEASAECVPFSNGTDSVTVSGVEYFIDADNEDNLCTNEDVLLEEHIISLAKSHTIIYMLVYENGASSLSSFDTRDKTFKTLVLFESLVTSFAVLNQNIYFVLNGDIAFYNIVTARTEILKASCDAELLYFSSPLTLKYYSKSRGLSAIRLDGIVMDSDKKENDDVYVPRLTAPEKDDPYYTTLNPLHRGGYGMVPNGGNCTCYAYGRSYENLGYDPKLCTRAAGKWYAYNKEEGTYAYGSEPALGAVAVWTKSGGDGHVAVVEIIDGDTVITSESGWQTFYFKTVTRYASDSNFSASSSYSFVGFIYVMGHPKSGDGTTDIKFDSLSLPNNLRCGSPFTLRGSIVSVNSPLTSVSAHITDSEGNIVLSKEVEPNTYFYMLRSSEIDSAMTFGTLMPDDYILHYSAEAEDGTLGAFMHPFTVEEAMELIGDINADGTINSRDLARLQRAVSSDISEEKISAFDVDKNGKLDSRDIAALQRLIFA